MGLSVFKGKLRGVEGCAGGLRQKGDGEILGVGSDAASDWSDEEKAVLRKRSMAHLIPLTETYFDETISPGTVAAGNKATTCTLLAEALLAVLLVTVAVVTAKSYRPPTENPSVTLKKE